MKFRKNSKLRIKLLNKINSDLSQIIHDTTLEPANLESEFRKEFEFFQKEIAKAREKIWFQSNKKTYLPSRNYDANFLEWFRVYPEYINYINDLLIGKNSVICDLFFERKKFIKL